MGDAFKVFRLAYHDMYPVGTISRSSMTFSYDPNHLSAAWATPLSFSLPLSNLPYKLDAFQPYFEGLLPEGEARRALAGELRIPEQDWLSPGGLR
ncbi:HipA N-terminal domain-containing protein [Enorma phocaeensis]|uniref:HipA N-terminal domain-containing protein n=1 Tax=Enorma phocaeensis TaxID=1871019 RepID=A0ABT7VAE3_9ACTN|nr:HipA N-terminal domain-containing protein [Enorma phocaeensis]MDM8275469.1 HipA N-terminal domain-containing protein [Enorma phocaeensis]